MDRKSKAEIFEKINKVIIMQLGTSDKTLPLKPDLEKDLGADSLDIVELIMLLENEFSIEIPEEYAFTIKTVPDIQKMVLSLLNPRAEGE